MLEPYNLIFQTTMNEQSDKDLSFIGGYPRIPSESGLPKCQLCHSLQTFFCQIAFPSEHPWGGLSLAVFQCTSCVDENHLIPEMLEGELSGIDIPEGFLDRYQINFRFLIFKTNSGVMRRDYEQLIMFTPISIEPSRFRSKKGNRLGGEPEWHQEDETPSTYGVHKRMYFFVQLDEELRFDLIPGAPGQKRIVFFPDDKETRDDYYLLFNGNHIYVFGTDDRSNPLVYVVTQS